MSLDIAKCPFGQQNIPIREPWSRLETPCRQCVLFTFVSPITSNTVPETEFNNYFLNKQRYHISKYYFSFMPLKSLTWWPLTSMESLHSESCDKYPVPDAARALSASVEPQLWQRGWPNIFYFKYTCVIYYEQPKPCCLSSSLPPGFEYWQPLLFGIAFVDIFNWNFHSVKFLGHSLRVCKLFLRKGPGQHLLPSPGLCGSRILNINAFAVNADPVPLHCDKQKS